MIDNQILKVEEKYVWLDEDGVQCSPIHENLGSAVRHKGNWKPYDEARDRYRKRYGSTKSPRRLVGLEVLYKVKETELSKAISDAFATEEEEQSQ